MTRVAPSCEGRTLHPHTNFKMKYIIIHKSDNGYTCRCCRQEWETTQEITYCEDEDNPFTLEEIQKFNKMVRLEFPNPNTKIYRVAEEIQ